MKKDFRPNSLSQISRLASILKPKRRDSPINIEKSFESRFKFTDKNIKLVVHERGKALKEKVEVLTKNMRDSLFAKLEKTDKLRKLRESVFCQIMDHPDKTADFPLKLKKDSKVKGDFPKKLNPSKKLR